MGKFILHNNINVIINCAAYTAVDKAESNSVIADSVNHLAVKNLAQISKENDIKLIHISTDYVFDGDHKNPYTEKDVTNPMSIYGHTKLEGEKAIKRLNCQYILIRTAWVYSEHGNNFLKTMLKLSKDHNTLNIVNDQIGGPTPARDIARACMEIAKQLILDPTKSGIYHFSGTPDTSWFKFAICIFKVANINTRVYPILTEKFPISTKRPLNSRLDCSNTFEKFNLKRPNWHEGLTEILKDLEVI